MIPRRKLRRHKISQRHLKGEEECLFAPFLPARLVPPLLGLADDLFDKPEFNMNPQVFCSHSALVDLDALVANPRNPNTHPEKQIELLAKIIKHQGWRNPIVVSKRSGFIVKGHGRYLAAKLLGCEQVPVDYQDYENEATEYADMIADNRIAELSVLNDKELQSLLSELDGVIDLDLTGFTGNALEDMLTAPPSEEDEAAEAEKVKLKKLELNERMEKAKYVFWAFSGGRDSTRALMATWQAFKDSGKHCEVIYIENTCEFPDLIMHIKRVCKMLDAKLTTVHPNKTYLTEYFEKGHTPDSLYMDCVEKLINEPMDKYIASVVGKEDYILVRGGQPKQKTSRSGTDEVQEVKNKPNMIIYNPAFAMTKEQLEAKIPEWPGYAAGFQRTACWCCPFQCAEQYDALKLNYPLLFEEMKKIMGAIKVKSYGLKSYDAKFRYWEKEGVQLMWDRNRKKIENS